MLLCACVLLLPLHRPLLGTPGLPTSKQHQCHQHSRRHLAYVWWQSHAQSTGQAGLSIDGLRSSFPRYAFRDRALASEITISNLHPPPGTLVSSLVSSQANSIRKYPHTHCLQNYCPRQPADMSILTLPHHISHLAHRTSHLPHISPPAAPACLLRPTVPPAVRSRST
jgi:hypothetical protein